MRGALHHLPELVGVDSERLAVNHAKALEGWHTPNGLLELLKQNEDEAYAKLKVEPMPYIDPGYRRAAIVSVETARSRQA